MNIFVGEVSCEINDYDYPIMEQYAIGASDSFQGCRNIWEEYKAKILKREEDEGGNLHSIVVENTDTDLEINDGIVTTNYHYEIMMCKMNSVFPWLV